MTHSAPTPVQAKLYSDAEIRKLANFDIDEQEEQYGGLRHSPYLDVVPHGEAYPREKVFQALGIEEGRLRDFRWYWSFHVVFLIWQVSPSYDIKCMTAINDPENESLKMTDPRRKVYGIQLKWHSE